jgi:hypothetical protein
MTNAAFVMLSNVQVFIGQTIDISSELLARPEQYYKCVRARMNVFVRRLGTSCVDSAFVCSCSYDLTGSVRYASCAA